MRSCAVLRASRVTRLLACLHLASKATSYQKWESDALEATCPFPLGPLFALLLLASHRAKIEQQKPDEKHCCHLFLLVTVFCTPLWSNPWHMVCHRLDHRLLGSHHEADEVNHG